MRMWLAPHCVRLTWRARLEAVAVLGAFAVLLGAAPAYASPTWLPQAELSPAGCTCGVPAAATDAAGDVTVAFLDDSLPPPDSALGLAVARHPAGGTWSSPVGVGPMADPVMAGNAAGDTVLAYVNGFDVNAIVDTAGEPWSTATTSTVSTASTGGPQTPPTVAIDSKGDVIVAWEAPAGDGSSTLDAAYRPAGGAWHQPLPVGDDVVKGITPSVAFTPGGEAMIVWDTENGGDQAVASATTTTGTSWTSPIQVATGTTFLAVQVALDSGGEATAAYSGFDSTDSEYDLGASELPPGVTSWHSDGNLARRQTSRIRRPSISRSTRPARPRSSGLSASTSLAGSRPRCARPAELGALRTHSQRLPRATSWKAPRWSSAPTARSPRTGPSTTGTVRARSGPLASHRPEPGTRR